MSEPSSIYLLDKRCHMAIKKAAKLVYHTSLPRKRDREDVINRLKQNLKQADSTTSTKIRNRRTPWFGFVARKAFGLMDYDDHEHISHEIDKLYNDQREITTFVNNSTHIIKSEINKIISDQNNTKARVTLLSNTINSYATKVGNEIEKMKLRLHFMQRADERVQRTSSLLRYLKEAESAIEDAKRGVVSGGIFSPDQLRNATRDITTRFPNLNPPQPVDHINLQILSSIAKVNTGRIDNEFLIIITLSLFNQITFQLYQIRPIPVPQTIGGAMRSLLIRPSKDYLAIDALQDQYFLADTETIKNCKTISTDIACEINVPLKSIKDNTECELQLYLKPNNEIMKQCDVRILPKCSTQLIKLHQSNSWAYSTYKTENFIITCDSSIRIEHQIHGSGTFTLSPGCVLTSDHLVIKGTEEETDTIGIFAFPTINLTHLVTNLTEKPKPPHLLTNIVEEPVGENTLLSPWGDNLEGNENRLTRIGLHHQEESKHRYITIANTGAVLSIITSLVLFFGYYYYGCCCNCLKPLQKFKTRKQKSFQGKTNETFELTDTISTYPSRPGSPGPAKHQQSLPGVHGRQKITPSTPSAPAFDSLTTTTTKMNKN
ncbi:Similar to LdOrf-130: Envelope fusion protein (Lymantria dispar multicapsid nuclear polyhedrosis virus) [Cotesia congregata]|uniref:Similar to LdOrf-130: Envelope fusion protein (Lymantria dispar multicapsid nuclear polyhedrosis virus) n=1 Tax=Cotesia congregata TaxID=51543 RepID=A0A8J2H5Q3_COTCN|nr:Similar to LdOrf-130: Envelope fusion protein (Lymantria dispar multicapsid nuclear polyhedrosis virus) [Cotesia congregata]